MMGERLAMQESLFYEFCLEDLGDFGAGTP
jgi:hypothetical protein